MSRLSAAAASPSRREAERLLLISDEVADLRMTPRERAGLVEDDGVDFGEALHVAPALDDDAAPRRQRHRRQDGGRRRDADAGAVIDDDQRQEAVEIEADRRPSPTASAQRRQHQAVGETFGVVLHARVADRRRVDQPHDLAGCRVRAHPQSRGSSIVPRAVTVAAKAASPDAAHHRQALAGDGLLVDQRAAVDDLAIDRNHLAGIDHDLIADRQRSRAGTETTLPSRTDPGRLGLEFEQIADRALGPGRRSDP